MSDNFVDSFPKLQKLLEQERNFVTYNQFSNIGRIPPKESIDIMTNYYLRNLEDKNLISLFSATFIEDEKISNVLIPSWSQNLTEFLKKRNVLDFYVFCLGIKANTVFDLNNFSLLANELEIPYETIKAAIVTNPIKASVTKAEIKPENKDSFNKTFDKKIKIENIKSDHHEQGEEFYYEGSKVNQSKVGKRKHIDTIPEKINEIIPEKVNDNINIMTNHFNEEISSVIIADEVDKEPIRIPENVPRKILKTRKVKKTVYNKNEKGAMVVEDIWEDEEYLSEEKPFVKQNTKNNC